MPAKKAPPAPTPARPGKLPTKSELLMQEFATLLVAIDALQPFDEATAEALGRKIGKTPGGVADAIAAFRGLGYNDDFDMPAGWTQHAWKAVGGYANTAARKGKENKNRSRERIWFSPACLPAA